MAERNPLSQPGTRSWLPKVSVDSETFGTFAESFARFMGTAKFLVYMTVFVIVWVTINLVGLFGLKWDPYPFILLNLFLSLVAAIQAPIIMMSQNRQSAKDRLQASHDYEVNLKAEIEIMALHEKLDELRAKDLAQLIASVRGGNRN